LPSDQHIHAILIAFLVGKSRIRNQKKRNEMWSFFVRVDMVAMPTHTLNELKNLSSGVEEVKPEEIEELKTEKVKQKFRKPTKKL
jgi:hypothetical protein